MTAQNKKYLIAGGIGLGIYIAYKLYKKNEETKALDAAKSKALVAAKATDGASSLVASTTAPAGAQTFISSQANPDAVAQSF